MDHIVGHFVNTIWVMKLILDLALSWLVILNQSVGRVVSSSDKDSSLADDSELGEFDSKDDGRASVDGELSEFHNASPSKFMELGCKDPQSALSGGAFHCMGHGSSSGVKELEATRRGEVLGPIWSQSQILRHLRRPVLPHLTNQGCATL